MQIIDFRPFLLYVALKMIKRVKCIKKTIGSCLRNIVIKSDEKRLVYGEVYSPLHVDTDGEAMTASEIEKMAYLFLERGLTSQIDVQHNQKESGCSVVESFLARKSDPDGFIEGAWVMCVRITPELWPEVKKGNLNGFSMFGSATHISTEAMISVAERMTGDTEKSNEDGLLPPHSHSVNIAFKGGRIVPGETLPMLGHVHKIAAATATLAAFPDSPMEHSHRLIMIGGVDEH